MELTAQILTTASALGVGYLLGYLNHGLTSRRESDSRRRVFRGTIRAIAARIEPAHFISLHKTYLESVPEVRDECSKIADDIRFWRRKRFTTTGERYCTFKQSDIVPPPPSAAATPEEMAARKKKHHEAKAMLAETLERMIGYAR
jgi:hypothetical protein